MNGKPTEETFLKDVSKHTMAVLLDKGVYRHLQFKDNGSNVMWFDIVTWPGFLAYSGDMGCFVFSRLKDMFEFFRTRPRDEKLDALHINLGYWAEKLEAVDRCGREPGAKQFSPEIFRERVEEHVTQWIEEFKEEYDSDKEETAKQREAFAEELREAVEDDVTSRADDGEHEARRALNDFSFTFNGPDRFCPTNGHKYEFSDTWEWSLGEYTYRFIWCCYAIAWAIRQYDAQKETEHVPE
jgi:hypothetical protein